MKQKKIPMRMCVGCREMKEKRSLIRVVRSPEGEVSLDAGGKKPGRGAYVCRNAECLKTAIKRKAFNRVCKRNLDEKEISRLVGQVLDSYQGGMDVKES